MADYPTLSIQFDASSFNEARENLAAGAGEMEGGYVISRRRHTRAARRTFTFKYVDISETDKGLLTSFWETVGGGSLAFNWTNPVTAEALVVRFGKGMTLKFDRTGYGTNHRWDSDTIMLEEV